MDEPSATPQPMSELDRLIGILFDPKPAFADIVARGGCWWLPLALLVALAIAITWAFTERVGWERFMREQIAASPRAQQLTPEQREQAIQQQLRFVPYFAAGGALLSWPVVTLIVAGCFLFVFNVIGGTEIEFRRAFDVTCYSMLPLVLPGLLALVLLFIKDPADFDLQNPVASNLGAFLDPSAVPAWLLSVARSADLFVIWVLLVLATGFSSAARRLAWAKAFRMVLVTWVVWLVVKGVWSWIWS